MKRGMKATVAAIAASTLLVLPGVACAPVSAGLKGVQSAAGNIVLPVSEEVKLGRQLAREVEKESKLHSDVSVQNYVASVGRRVAAKATDKPSGITFTFKVIDDDKQINAFALPGGHIYVYTGLLKMMDDEAELASVLAHEIAHVTQRHIAERLAAQYGIQTVAAMALGENQAGVAGLAAQIAAAGTLIQYTRSMESEADAKGLPYMVRAGYDPNGMVRLFTKFAKQGEGPRALKWLQDHPMPSERVSEARQRIAQLKNPPTRRNEAAYERFEDEI